MDEERTNSDLFLFRCGTSRSATGLESPVATRQCCKFREEDLQHYIDQDYHDSPVLSVSEDIPVSELICHIFLFLPCEGGVLVAVSGVSHGWRDRAEHLPQWKLFFEADMNRYMGYYEYRPDFMSSSGMPGCEPSPPSRIPPMTATINVIEEASRNVDWTLGFRIVLKPLTLMLHCPQEGKSSATSSGRSAFIASRQAPLIAMHQHRYFNTEGSLVVQKARAALKTTVQAHVAWVVALLILGVCFALALHDTSALQTSLIFYVAAIVVGNVEFGGAQGVFHQCSTAKHIPQDANLVQLCHAGFDYLRVFTLVGICYGTVLFGRSLELQAAPTAPVLNVTEALLHNFNESLAGHYDKLDARDAFIVIWPQIQGNFLEEHFDGRNNGKNGSRYQLWAQYETYGNETLNEPESGMFLGFSIRFLNGSQATNGSQVGRAVYMVVPTGRRCSSRTTTFNYLDFSTPENGVFRLGRSISGRGFWMSTVPTLDEFEDVPHDGYDGALCPCYNLVEHFKGRYPQDVLLADPTIVLRDAAAASWLLLGILCLVCVVVEFLFLGVIYFLVVQQAARMEKIYNCLLFPQGEVPTGGPSSLRSGARRTTSEQEDRGTNLCSFEHELQSVGFEQGLESSLLPVAEFPHGKPQPHTHAEAIYWVVSKAVNDHQDHLLPPRTSNILKQLVEDHESSVLWWGKVGSWVWWPLFSVSLLFSMVSTMACLGDGNLPFAMCEVVSSRGFVSSGLGTYCVWCAIFGCHFQVRTGGINMRRTGKRCVEISS